MPLFRKRPVVVEAVQFTGRASWRAVEALAAGGRRVHYGDELLIIETLEGDHRANVGDWIIKGVQGELYPCKPDIFAATYEEVP